MNSSNSIRAIWFLVFMAIIARSQAHVIDIKTKGAKGDGRSDDGPAIMTAWKEACAIAQPSTVMVPRGTYFTLAVSMVGPCKAPITFQATGATFTTSPDAKKFKNDWITFEYVDKLTLSGGTFDGQGQATWKASQCKSGKCTYPANLRFHEVTNSHINGVTSLNSKFFHISLLGCHGSTLDGININAPADSANTDGIHVGRTNGLTITKPTIKTGDDCISFGDGNNNIRVSGATCGPGHGISVGSLGKYDNEGPVQGIWVTQSTITKTTNGVRIKTFQNSPKPGTATDMHFEDITMQDVQNAILIDQEYCPHGACSKASPSKVKISKVSFKNIKGTTTTKAAIKLVCSKSLPCEGVELANVNLKYTGPKGGEAISECANVKPVLTGTIVPKACTALPSPPSSLDADDLVEINGRKLMKRVRYFQ